MCDYICQNIYLFIMHEKKNPFIEKDDSGNPFKIEENVEITGNRVKDPNLDHLITAMRKMTIDKTKPLWIPISIYPTQTKAAAQVEYAKKTIRETYTELKNAGYSVRTVKDDNQKYLGIRVWRIA